MGKIITFPIQKEEVTPALAYNRELEESDYAIWKARQEGNNVEVLQIVDDWSYYND